MNFVHLNEFVTSVYFHFIHLEQICMTTTTQYPQLQLNWQCYRENEIKLCWRELKLLHFQAQLHANINNIVRCSTQYSQYNGDIDCTGEIVSTFLLLRILSDINIIHSVPYCHCSPGLYNNPSNLVCSNSENHQGSKVVHRQKMSAQQNNI